MTLAQLLERFHIDSSEQLDWQIKYNIAPSLSVPVIVQLADGRDKVMLMKWGMVPPWQKEDKYQPYSNLRTDTLLNKPGFKRILESSRCIVPVDGFNEWTQTKPKLPYRYVMKSGNIFGLGGLFQTLTLPNGKTLYTMSLITTEANKLVGQIHDRMPVIIPKSREAAWLNPRSRLSDYAVCLSPYPAEEMNAYRVSTNINSGRVDSPDLIVPAV
jgi:putative SOS response-associated peptidase YedK